MNKESKRDEVPDHARRGRMIHKEQLSLSVRPCFAASTLILLMPFFVLLSGCGNSISEPAPHATPSTPSVFRFVAWSDTQGGNTTLAALSAQVLTLNPAFTLYAGDGESQGFTTSGRNRFLAAIDGNSSNGVSAMTFFVRGNHDRSDTSGWQQYYELASVAGAVGATHYSAFTPDLTYSFDYQNSHFVAIDVLGDADVITPAQISWLDSDLAAAEVRGLTHAFIYFHGPIFCVESVHCEFTGKSGSYAPQALIEVLNKHPLVSASFHGHEHVLAYTHMDTTRLPSLTHDFEEIVAGTAGSPLYTCDLPSRTEWCDSVKGFATVDVSGPAVRISFYQQGSSTPIKTIDFSK